MILRIPSSLILIHLTYGKKSFPAKKHNNTKSSITRSGYAGLPRSLNKYSLNNATDKNVNALPHTTGNNYPSLISYFYRIISSSGHSDSCSEPRCITLPQHLHTNY